MKLDAMYPFAEDLRHEFRLRFGVMDAEHEMARELIAINMAMKKLEDRVRDLELDRHRAFHREPSIHYMRTHSLPVDDNDWFAPEKDDDNA